MSRVTPSTQIISPPLFIALAAFFGVTIAALAAATFWIVYASPTETVRPGVVVADVDVSGVQADELRQMVSDRLGRYASSTIEVKLPSGMRMYTAAELGYRPEIEATVAQIQAQGVPLKRDAILAELNAAVSQRTIAPSFSLDESRLNGIADELAKSIQQPAVNAELRVNPDTSVQLIAAKSGQQLDRAEFVRRAQAAFRGLESSVPVPIQPVSPAITDADALAAKLAAEKFVGGELQVKAGEEHAWTLTRGDLASWIEFAPGKNGEKITFQLHPERPRNWLIDRAREIAAPARDARVRLDGGKVVVVEPDQEGVALDIAGALDTLSKVGTSSERVANLPVTVLKARVTAADAATLQFPDLLAEAATVYGGGISERNHNVELAASRLDGVVIPDGAVFSFNDAVGRTRLKDGYQVGYGIVASEDGAETVPSVAGGICQVATTVFHSAFWAGLPIVERYGHPYWIPKYGMPPKGLTGLDATVDEDSGLDFRFKNTTGAPLLVQSATDGNQITFRLRGTQPDWKVEVGTPVLTNVVKADPNPVRQEDDTLAVGRTLQIEEARDGFDSSVTRTVSRGGEVIDEIAVKTHYAPSRNLVLSGTKR